MADNDRTLRYNVELNVDYFKRRLEGIHAGVQEFEKEIGKANDVANGFGKSTEGINRLGNAFKQVATEAQKLNEGIKGIGQTAEFETMMGNLATLRKMLRELQQEKEIVARGGFVAPYDKDGNTGPNKSLETILAQIKAVKDEMKYIQSLDLDKITDAKAASQLKEVTAAIKAQERALASYDKSLERHKALSQSTFNKYRADIENANKTLAKYDLDTVENPYKKQGWADYAKELRETDQVRKVKANIAEIQAGIVAKQKAEIANQQKILAQEKAIADAKRKQVNDTVRSNIAENRKVMDARADAKAGTYTGNKEFAQAWSKVRADAEKWSIAISRGKQITDEELKAAQRITSEYRKQVETLAQGDKHVLRNMPQSPVLDYSNAKDFNAASTAARDTSAIAGNIRKQSEEVQNYDQQIRKLQSRCESLYATYRKDPSKENLQALSQTRAELSRVTKEYARYQKEVSGASRTVSEFQRKAMSHLQWIATGAGIAMAASAPYFLEDRMTSLDYAQAGIRQVIPQIEGIEDSKQYGDVATQIMNMNKAMDEFIGTASKFGVKTDEVLESAKSIGRMYGQGELGVKNTALFTSQAAKMAVADAFSMEEATKGLEAAMAQWNLQTEDTNKLLARSSEILDIWTRAAHSGAASGQDISQAIQVAGASAAQAGVSFSFFTSLVETGVRTTARSGNEIGQALKSLFVTLGNGKAEKALNLWGIKTKELGTDGVEHVRSLEKQILDISLAVSSTDKDTTKFLTTLSGGKYQYSKVAAILKNYKEILRMQGILNDGDTKGFTDKQVEVQLDTVKRQVERFKSDVDGIVMDIARGGGVNSLKWLASTFHNIAVGIREMNKEAGQGKTNMLSLTVTLGKVLAGLLAVKTALLAVNKLRSRKAEAKAFADATGGYVKDGGGQGINGAIKDWWNAPTQKGQIKGTERAYEYLKAKEYVDAHTASLDANTAAEKTNTAATTGNAASKGVEATAERANAGATAADTAAKTSNTVAERANAGATAGNTTAKGANTVAETANTRAHGLNTAALLAELRATTAGTAAMGAASAATRVFSAAAGVAAMAGRALSVAIGALGGPVGAALLLATALVPAFLSTAEAEGAATDAAQKHVDAMDEEIAKAQQEVDQVQRRRSAAMSITEAYNKVQASMSTCAEGSEQYKQKQDQLKDMTETLSKITGEEAQKFMEGNQIKIDAVQKYMDKEVEKTAQVKLKSAEETQAQIDMTTAHIEATKKRLEDMKKEVAGAKALGKTYTWLDRVIAQHKVNAAQAKIDQANDLAGEIEHYHDVRSLDKWIEHPLDNAFRLLTFGDARINEMGGLEKAKEAATQMQSEGYAELEQAKRGLAKVDTEKGEEMIAEYEKDIEDSIAEVERLKGNLANATAAAEAIKDSAKQDSDNVSEHPTVDDNNYGKERHPKGRTGNHKKPDASEVLTDDLSLAIRAAANSEVAKQNGITEPLLRAIAAHESGGDTTIKQWDENGNLLEDYLGSGHFGMFQVTQADADRFGTGDISVPINNAMTAVKLLAEKLTFTQGGKDMDTALRLYSGGQTGYSDAIRANETAQKASWRFGNDEYGGYTSFNGEVLASMENLLGQPYGGSSWHDDFQKVCTTLIQRALADAGVDTATVDNLTGNANNWSGAAGGAFHSYAEIQNGSYVPKEGDIGLTNMDESGHAGHVIMIGPNGQGYYAAAGSGRNSAYYSTNWQTAFADSGIEGVISLNELTGNPYTQSVAGHRKKPKTIHDFQLDPYAEAEYRQRQADEATDKATLEGKEYDFYHGGEKGQDRASLAVAELKLASSKATKEILDADLDSTRRNIQDYLSKHKEIGEELMKKGKTWEDLVPAEREQMAKLADKDGNGFAKEVENEEKLRQKVVETTKAIKEQQMERDKAMGYMNPQERNSYLAQKALDDYEEANPYGNSLAKRKALLEAKKYLEENVRLAEETYAKEKADTEKAATEALAKVEEAEKELNRLQAKLAKGDKSGGVDALNKKIKTQDDLVKKLKDDYQSLITVGNKGLQDADKNLKKAKSDLKEIDTQIVSSKQFFHTMSVSLNQELLNGFTNAFTQVLTEGKSFKEAMGDLFNEIGKMALQMLIKYELFRLFKYGFGMDMGDANGLATGGTIPGRATGGDIPGYADGGQTAGAITGAGTGTSDSILAYVANKDRFVYLSNGEYVMTAEATRRIGKSNLDRMNYGKYADGGALSPTPYVPNLSASVTKKAQSIDRNNPNAKMEQLMQQQTDVLKGMGKDGNGGSIVVLNTQASSADVLKALQQNPRAVQAILGGQQRRGFR